MAVIRKILANLDRMSPADREIGKFVAEHPDRMLELSSSALARETGRSQSSVIKFAQRLGFSSYQDLKLAVSSARGREWRLPASPMHGSIEQGDSFGTIFEKLIASKVRAMRETMAANGGREMSRAVEALAGTRRIFLVGGGASSLVAADFAFKLLKIGRVVIHSGDAHVHLANVSTMTKDDTLMAISYSGESLDTLRVAELAKKRGGTVIALTGMRDNPLARLADILIHTVADEEQVRSSSITARDAQLAVTDQMFLLAMQSQEDANTYIRQSEQAALALKDDRYASAPISTD